MRRKIILEPQAKTDIITIREWYRNQKPGLEDEFMTELSEYIELLKQNPTLFRIRFQPLRAVVLKKFPYLAYYFITRDEVHIIAVLAAKQDQDNILGNRID